MGSKTLDVLVTEKGIETYGIERVLPQNRSHIRISDNCTLWLSANLAISTFALGTLATNVFALGFWDSVWAILVFNILGTLPVALLATLGPQLGLRQMTISRFSFGWAGAIVMSLFNVGACIGWSAVNVIVGGQLIATLSGGAIPQQIGILVITILTLLISIYGYRYIHLYERFAWIPMATIFFIITIIGGSHITIIATPAWDVAHIASFVSFGGAVYGFATGWSSFAADYNVKQPENTSTARIFWLTFLGVVVPCIVLEVLGMALTTAFKASDSGSLLSATMRPFGGLGTFLVALLALSVVANNIPNDYSLALSMQVLGKPFQRLSREVWSLIGAVIYVLIAVSASANFSETLSNYLLLVAYWLGPWSIIVLLEHFVFRGGRYNVEDWDTPAKLPLGWAAIVAMLAGVVGVLLGAAQVYYVGPIAHLFNPPYGMDIGFEMGLIFAGLVYIGLRPLELARTKR